MTRQNLTKQVNIVNRRPLSHISFVFCIKAIRYVRVSDGIIQNKFPGREVDPNGTNHSPFPLCPNFMWGESLWWLLTAPGGWPGLGGGGILQTFCSPGLVRSQQISKLQLGRVPCFCPLDCVQPGQGSERTTPFDSGPLHSQGLLW